MQVTGPDGGDCGCAARQDEKWGWVWLTDMQGRYSLQHTLPLTQELLLRCNDMYFLPPSAVFATLTKLLALPGDQLALTSLLPPPETRAIEGLIAALNLSFAVSGAEGERRLTFEPQAEGALVNN